MSVLSSKDRSVLENHLFGKKLINFAQCETQEEYEQKLAFYLAYLEKKQPGMDSKLVRRLKALIKQSEGERTWFSSLGIHTSDIISIQAEFFSNNPSNNYYISEYYIQKFADICENYHPEVITLPWDDSEAHFRIYYKTLKTVVGALSLLSEDIHPRIWLYRPLSEKMSFAQADQFHLIREEDFQEIMSIYRHCYPSQYKSYKGLQKEPLSTLMKQKQKNNLKQLKVLLGKNYFRYHPNLLIRRAKGLILFKELSINSLSYFLSSITEHREFEIESEY